MIPCDKCRDRAVIYQRYSGKHLCARHFEEDVHRKVKQVLRKYRIFGGPSKIAVAISGGKDSTSLLYILKSLFSDRKDLELVAVAIDEGIAGYRSDTIDSAKAVAERLEVNLEIRSFDETFGVTTDYAASLGMEQGPCTFCGVLRKNLLNRTSRELGADALATGHNLDDESQTVLMNYLRGDLDRLYRLRPRKVLEGLVPRIKPLRRVPEREVALYAITHDLPLGTSACPHISRAIRREVKDMLNDFEHGHPGTKYSIMSGFDRMLEFRPPGTFQTVPCVRCGEPCGDGLCQSCRLLEKIRAKSLRGGHG
ncbi:MAG: TIGR00269 family protein [Methanothrix sp.]|nr:MAG: TIGR00269 family protein [Methanothrix sp.]